MLRNQPFEDFDRFSPGLASESSQTEEPVRVNLLTVVERLRLVGVLCNKGTFMVS